VLFLPGEEVRLREHALAGEVVGKGDPALLRFRGEAVHLLPGEVQHGGAGDARAVEEGGEALEEAAVDLAKIMEVARRIAKGAKVPSSDERKLMEYSMEL